MNYKIQLLFYIHACIITTITLRMLWILGIKDILKILLIVLHCLNNLTKTCLEKSIS